MAGSYELPEPYDWRWADVPIGTVIRYSAGGEQRLALVVKYDEFCDMEGVFDLLVHRLMKPAEAAGLGCASTQVLLQTKTGALDGMARSRAVRARVARSAAMHAAAPKGERAALCAEEAAARLQRAATAGEQEAAAGLLLLGGDWMDWQPTPDWMEWEEGDLLRGRDEASPLLLAQAHSIHVINVGAGVQWALMFAGE
ncbi:hypothetical protein WJX81_004374 [Elliptochloris bilobata]|uniref:Uncharacterized protein n=1 Tax=Elliptochloris bilobata TaxID=381761 RepID=A0AAW1S0H1_9CHLO